MRVAVRVRRVYKGSASLRPGERWKYGFKKSCLFTVNVIKRTLYVCG